MVSTSVAQTSTFRTRSFCSSCVSRGRKAKKTVFLIASVCFYILSINQLLIYYKTVIKSKSRINAILSTDIPKSIEGIYENFPSIKTLSKQSHLEIPSFPLDGGCFWRWRNGDQKYWNGEIQKEDEEEGEEEKKRKEKKIEEEFQFLKTDEGQQYKKILFHYHKTPDCFRYGEGYKIFDESCCLERRCFLTEDKTKIPLKEFDAILIQHISFRIQNLPKERYPHQRYIFIEMEAPDGFSNGLTHYRRIFNWTMTNRRDSDIQARYGYAYPIEYLPIDNSAKLDLKSSYKISLIHSIMENKSKMAVWLVSHCTTMSRRESYVRKLQKYIDVDIYGKCGTFNCTTNNTEECYKSFEKNYKFYLSFENSVCNDYITEKLFNLLRFNIIPVVYGGGDYLTIAPPNSYINIRDFKSVRKLANYLRYLDRNDTAYMEYFKWKQDYFVSDGPLARKISLCNLCKKLHENSPPKTYHNMRNWYLKEAQCISYPHMPVP